MLTLGDLLVTIVILVGARVVVTWWRRPRVDEGRRRRELDAAAGRRGAP